MNTVFFDLETGGIDPSKHPIIQIAAIAVGSDLVERNHFEVKVAFDPAECDPEALKHNCYNEAVWKEKSVNPSDAIARFSAFLKEHADVRMVSGRTGKPYFVAQLIGHNAASFDGPFIQAFYRQYDAFLPASYRVMCTLQRAIWYFHERPDIKQPTDFKLATLCQYFGIELVNAHDALADIRATVALYRKLAETAVAAAA